MWIGNPIRKNLTYMTNTNSYSQLLLQSYYLQLYTNVYNQWETILNKSRIIDKMVALSGFEVPFWLEAPLLATKLEQLKRVYSEK